MVLRVGSKNATSIISHSTQTRNEITSISTFFLQIQTPQLEPNGALGDGGFRGQSSGPRDDQTCRLRPKPGGAVQQVPTDLFRGRVLRGVQDVQRHAQDGDC